VTNEYESTGELFPDNNNRLIALKGICKVTNSAYTQEYTANV